MQRTAAFVAWMALGLARASVLALPVAALALAPHASADVRKIQPKTVVVTKDNAALRCNDGPIYYPVRMLKSGDVLRADGEGNGWLRVEYPMGTKAYVKADDATFDAATKTVKLMKASKLMAANDAGARPWWYLLETDMPAGTTFQSAEPAKAVDGTIEGYLVPAPPTARGFIRKEMVRDATPEEGGKAAAASAPTTKTPEAAASTTVKPADTTKVAETPASASKPGETAAATAKPTDAPKTVETPKSATGTPATAAAPATVPTHESAASTTTTATATPGTTVTPSTTTTAGTPAGGPAGGGAEVVEVKPDGTTAPATLSPSTTSPAATAPTTPSKPEVTRRVDDLSVLRDMFDRVVKHSEDESEIQTVISEFNRSIDALPTSGDDGKIRRGLEQRRDVLVLRQEIIETRRKARNDAEIDARMKDIRLAVEQAERQAIYTIVGRMLPSTVYDGKRGMPLMYRIESPDISSTRTIGYVLPPREGDLGSDLLAKMGKLVGIIGDAKLDPALGLNIVAPSRVDEMQFSNGRLEPVPSSSGSPAPRLGPAPEMGRTQPRPSNPADSTPRDREQPIATPGTDGGEMNK